jgi:hypothetical protein
MNARPTVAVLLVVSMMLPVSCGGSDGGPLPQPSVSTTNAEDVDALVMAIGLEHEAMATLLLVFSQGGTKPLFDPTIDWSDPQVVADAYDSLHAVADKLRAHRPALEAALSSLEGKAAWAAAMGAGSGAAHARYALSLSGFFPSVFGWADGAKKSERDNIVAVLEKGGPGLQTQIHAFAQELRDEGRLGNLGADLGDSPDAFLTKLKAGELDDLALHNLNKDAANENPDYDAMASQVKGRPVDMLVKEGAAGVVAGGDSYWDLAKKTVAGGLGVAGAAFTKGTEMVEGVVGSIVRAEQALTAPLDLMASDAINALKDRAQAFIEDRTGLDEETAQALVSGLSDDFTGLVRQATASAEVSTGLASPESLLSDGWGSLQVGNAADLTGTMVTWLDDTASEVKMLLSPGPTPEAAAIVVPGGIEATVMGLAEGVAVTPPQEGVSAPAGQSTPVQLPEPVDGAEPAGDDTASGDDAWSTDSSAPDADGPDVPGNDAPVPAACAGIACERDGQCFCGGGDAAMCCCDQGTPYLVDCNGGCAWYGVCMFEGRVDTGDAYCLCLD